MDNTTPPQVPEVGRSQPAVPAAPRPLSSTSLISPPSHSTAVAASRAAKSGNGSGNNTTGILKSGTPNQHHHNSHRATKRAGSNASINSHHSAHSHNTHSTASTAHSPGSHDPADGRPKRVWKACERCRMKKTKCDGEVPCKRCKDDGLVCTSSTRKKTEYKQIPKGYAEVLENTQVALVATIHKLYAMVQSGQPWTLGEPELNERGQPVIHSISSKLGCIRPNNDPDLPFGSAIFPESDKDLNDLQSQLHDYHKQREAEQAAHPEVSPVEVKTEEPAPRTATQNPAARKRLSAKTIPATLLSTSAPTANSLTLAFDAASASSLEDMDNLSDLEDHRKNMFGRGNRTSSSVQSAGTMSPQSLTFNDFDTVTTTGTSRTDSITMPTMASPSAIAETPFNNWLSQPGMNLSSINTLGNLDTLGLNPTAIQRQQQQQQAPTGEQALAIQMRQQRIANALQGDAGLYYQQLPISTVSMSATTLAMAASNPAFFTGDMLPQTMFDYTIKPDMMNTDAMLGSGDPMIFDGVGSYDERLMS